MPTRTFGFGGGMTKKLLWTNPSQNAAFDAQTVTLSDSYDNYDYILIEYKLDINRLETAETIQSNFGINTTSNSMFMNLGSTTIVGNGSSSTRAVRRDAYDSTKKNIYFYNVYPLGGSGSWTHLCVPLKVYGIKGKFAGGVASKLLTHIKNTFFKLGGVF